MKKILSILFVLALIALAGYRYLGGFSTLVAIEQEMGPYTMVYEEVVWPYSKVGNTMNIIHADLKVLGVEQTAGIGLYFDDPATTPADQLRSEVGSVVTSIDPDKLGDYKTKTLQRGQYVVVEFPYKNMLSYFIGPKKAYPILSKYILEKWYKADQPMVEVYDIAAGVIYYMAPVVLFEI